MCQAWRKELKSVHLQQQCPFSGKIPQRWFYQMSKPHLPQTFSADFHLATCLCKSGFAKREINLDSPWQPPILLVPADNLTNWNTNLLGWICFLLQLTSVDNLSNLNTDKSQNKMSKDLKLIWKCQNSRKDLSNTLQNC